MSNNKFLISDFKFLISEKGVSLFITIFIMAIILAVVLGLSVILVSEIKIMREMGESVVSFFAADSGIEKTFYFDRKVIPEGATRGLCNICTGVCPDCQAFQCSGTDCDHLSCTDCQISFSTSFNGKEYEIKAIVAPTGKTTIKSYGSFKGIKRAIELIY